MFKFILPTFFFIFLILFNAFRFIQSFYIFYIILLIKNVYLIYLYTKRDIQTVQSDKVNKFIAYTSLVIPTLYLQGNTEEFNTIASLLSLIGFTVSTLGILDLGQSFGISPAKRKLVTSGLYQFTNHPIYIGYLIAEFSMVLKNLNNIYIFSISILLYYYRAKAEDKIHGR